MGREHLSEEGVPYCRPAVSRQVELLCVVCLCLTPVLVATGVARAREGRVFRAGAATSNITPPLDEGIVGGWDSPRATHIHDELHARCLVQAAPKIIDALLSMLQDLHASVTMHP